MKKIFFVLTSLLIFSNCNKKDTENQEKIVTNQDKPSKSDDLAIWTSNELGEHLSKKNDTLYITNYFATWCPYCMRGLPDYQKKMQEMAGEKVKFTFINLDDKSDWGKVKELSIQSGIGQKIKLFDTESITPEFFQKHMSQFTGAIPYTIISKGDKKQEITGLISKEEFNTIINSLK